MNERRETAERPVVKGPYYKAYLEIGDGEPELERLLGVEEDFRRAKTMPARYTHAGICLDIAMHPQTPAEAAAQMLVRTGQILEKVMSFTPLGSDDEKALLRARTLSAYLGQYRSHLTGAGVTLEDVVATQSQLLQVAAQEYRRYPDVSRINHNTDLRALLGVHLLLGRTNLKAGRPVIFGWPALPRQFKPHNPLQGGLEKWNLGISREGFLNRPVRLQVAFENPTRRLTAEILRLSVRDALYGGHTSDLIALHLIESARGGAPERKAAAVDLLDQTEERLLYMIDSHLARTVPSPDS